MLGVIWHPRSSRPPASFDNDTAGIEKATRKLRIAKKKRWLLKAKLVG
jgi:hypothetical protein